MFRDSELVSVTIEEFRRGLDGVTAEEALVRHPKADGSTMNAISWTVMHVANHWWNVARAVRGDDLQRIARPDGTPPTLSEAFDLLDEATRDLSWLEETTDEAMARTLPQMRNETVGQFLARAILHTWFHTGEINAARQLLGHPEIHFVGDAVGRVGWIPDREA